jgi:O-antigen biosynthesis protein
MAGPSNTAESLQMVEKSVTKTSSALPADNYEREIDINGETSVAKLLRWIKPGTSVLELGPASGAMSRLLKNERHCHVIGVEINEQAAQHAAPFCDSMLVRDLNDPQWVEGLERNSFDYVIFADVLEHLVDPEQTLQESIHLLKDSGEVLISIPNISYVGVIAELLKGDFTYRKDGLLDSTHLRFFTRKSLNNLLKQAGLQALAWDRTVMRPEFSEFRLNLKEVSPSLRSVLLDSPDSLTYQFLVKAKASTLPYLEEAPQPKKSPAKESSYQDICQLFWSSGNGFREEDSLSTFVPTGTENKTVSFTVDSPVTMLRFDPIDSRSVIGISDIAISDDNKELFRWNSSIGSLERYVSHSNMSISTIGETAICIPTNSDGQIFIPIQGSSKLSFKVSYNNKAFTSVSEELQKREQKLSDIETKLDNFKAETLVLKNERDLLEKQRDEAQNKGKRIQLALDESIAEHNALILHLEKQRDEAQNKGKRIQLALDESIAEHNALILHLNRTQQELREELHHHTQHNNALENNLRVILASTSWQITKPIRTFSEKARSLKKVLNAKHRGYINNLRVILASTSWQITKPIRTFSEKARSLKKVLNAKHRGYIGKLLRYYGKSSIVRYACTLLGASKQFTPYEIWRLCSYPTPTELRSYKKESLTSASPILFSIILPVFRPKLEWLRSAIESVRQQAYPHWELCIADDCSNDPGIRSLLSTYQNEDERIKVVFRKENGHIAASSNSALKISSGEYLVLLDHDDALAPHALYQLHKKISLDPSLDILYSDEDKISESGMHYEPTFKPKWSPEYFLAFMYTGHISCFRKSLVQKIGGFREGFEGSQDYDLLLRCSEQTKKIGHIADILYHWRAHQGSVAGNIACKTYAFTAAKRALNEALVRRDCTSAVITETEYSGLYRLRSSKPNYDIVEFCWNSPLPDNANLNVIKAGNERAAVKKLITALKGKRSTQECLIFGVWISTEYDSQVAERLPGILCLDNVAGTSAMVVSPAGNILSCGLSVSEGKVSTYIEGSSADQPGYRARCKVPWNVRSLSPGATYFDATLIDAIPSDLSSFTALHVALSLAAEARNERLTVSPSSQVKAISRIANISIKDIKLLKNVFPDISNSDPYYPEGLKSFGYSKVLPET